MKDDDVIAFAAKADGWTGWQSKHGYWNLTDGDGNKFVVCENWESPTFRDALLAAGYDPEHDDGQALRLAVKLRIAPHIDSNLTDCDGFTEAHLGDQYAATRRAILRAAAAIGETMP